VHVAVVCIIMYPNIALSVRGW